MARWLLLCILVAGCADVGETEPGPQRQLGDQALADPFGYGPDIEKLAAEKSAEPTAASVTRPAADRDGDSLADEWRRFWNP